MRYILDDVSQLINSADRVLWPLTDHLGTVRDLIKNDGVLDEHYVVRQLRQNSSLRVSVVLPKATVCCIVNSRGIQTTTLTNDCMGK